jgi:hypothetical protein
MKSDVGNDERPMAALDIFRGDGSFLHLEEDWRRGLGWWLVDDESRRRVSVLEATRLAPSGVAHEVFLEAQHLAWQLEAESVDRDSEPALYGELSELRREVALAGAADRSSPTTVMQTAVPVFSHRHADPLVILLGGSNDPPPWQSIPDPLPIASKHSE